MIVFINDKSVFNYLYRADLIKLLEINKSEKIISIGIMDGAKAILKIIWFVSVLRLPYFSSNLRSNIFCLIFIFRNGVVLFNGLGRYRKSYLFRSLLILLLNFRKSSSIFQNYADFRYFRRFSKSTSYWVPGSGGKVRAISKLNAFTVISRPDKLLALSVSLRSFIDDFDCERLSIVGCTTSDVKSLDFAADYLSAVGKVPQDDIFSFGNKFVQLSGYGEGIPHSLVDGIVSGLDVYLGRRDFVRYGLYKLGFEFKPVSTSWGILVCVPQARFSVSIDAVNAMYLSVLNEYLIVK